MQPDEPAAMDELSSTSEEEYGGGTELSATDFLVLGLLTFWTYTVWKYHQLLRRHMAARLAHFRERLDPATLAPESRKTYENLVAKGFACPAPRNVSLALYGASFALILSEIAGELLVLQGRIDMPTFERAVYLLVGGAASPSPSRAGSASRPTPTPACATPSTSR